MKIAAAVCMCSLFLAQHAGAAGPARVPEEDYGFLAVTDGPCMPKIGVGVDPKYEAECKRVTGPRRRRGRWYVDFETSFFTPSGKQYCMETEPFGVCLELDGEALPWPRRSDCGREYEVEFIGRRNLLPQFYEGAAYKIIVDKLISAKRLPDPYDEDCDPELHPELKAEK